MAIQIQVRRDTAANWTSEDPTLAEGEFGMETDTMQIKIGDGATAWVGLPYVIDSANPFDQDLNTTDPVAFTGLTSNGLTYPSADGTAGQSIVTDGAGTLSFASGANPFDQDLNTTDPVSFTGLTNNGLIYPTADGTAGQVIATDGAGTLSFASGANPFDQTLDTTSEATFDKLTLTGSIFEQQSVAAFSSGTLTLDLNEGNVFTHDLTANVTTVTINNIPGNNAAVGLTILIEADGTARTIAWPAAFKWPGGTAPTITGTNGKTDIFVAFTYDGGTTFMAFVAGQNL